MVVRPDPDQQQREEQEERQELSGLAEQLGEQGRQRLEAELEQLKVLGLDPVQIKSQSFITPSCGTGSLTPGLSQKVLMLTKELSKRVRGAL